MQMQEDSDLLHELRKMNRRTCFCFKKKIDKQLEERIVENCQKNPDFGNLVKEEGIDFQRLIESQKNKQQDELTK